MSVIGAQLRTIPPGQAPGALYRRVTTGDRVLAAGPLGEGGSEATGADDAALAIDWAARFGVPVWTHIYDGDDGSCISTVLVQP
jgi:hypothetical protein